MKTCNVWGSLQVPLFLDVPAFAAHCTGIRYALLCVVPTFYTGSSVLFWILGIMLQRWDRKQRRDDNSQEDNLIQSSREKSTRTDNHNVASDDHQPPADSYQPLTTDDGNDDDDGTKI